jgi:hypothetical protein
MGPSTAPETAVSGVASPTAAVVEGPLFTVGTMVEPTVDGLRVRSAPGTTAELTATLPPAAYGMVELGPLPADGYAWYLVSYAFLNSSGVTEGGIGWIAAGSSSSPWLVETSAEGWYTGLIAGYAAIGSSTEGPVEIEDWNHGVRWAAVGTSCRLEVALESATDRVSIVSTTVDGYADGEVSELFLRNPDFTGRVMIDVETDCAWAVSVVRYQG